MGCFHGEAARFVLAKVQGNVFAHFHAVAKQSRIRTQNSQFGLLGQILFATTTTVQMATSVRNILDATSYKGL
jgi:K+-transporting ATPase A subunit